MPPRKGGSLVYVLATMFPMEGPTRIPGRRETGTPSDRSCSTRLPRRKVRAIATEQESGEQTASEEHVNYRPRWRT